MVETLDDRLTTDTPPDDSRHYFSKADMDRNLFDGSSITALCGFVKEGLAHPAETLDLPICRACREAWEGLEND